ncbi:MAG: hypothetical protein BGO96_08595 [Micrococcales bacterium 73-15]|mgnify:CR=1 FL=1|uniref:hypothetical protein n=1 Tax=Salana multivorans TaxID=120377 RepID=UPI000968EE59|nr:hypothetical protein [Salana multivorans]OJX95667.1 MAG: hypothetical protein BGO96_08595 [Micrococcales bacterium 73-15]
MTKKHIIYSCLSVAGMTLGSALRSQWDMAAIMLVTGAVLTTFIWWGEKSAARSREQADGPKLGDTAPPESPHREQDQ